MSRCGCRGGRLGKLLSAPTRQCLWPRVEWIESAVGDLVAWYRPSFWGVRNTLEGSNVQLARSESTEGYEPSSSMAVQRIDGATPTR